MTTTIRRRIVTGWLLTMLLAAGAFLVGAPPFAEPTAASPAHSGDVYVLAPRPLASDNAAAPWLCENLIPYRPVEMSPLKPGDDTRPAEPETNVEPTLPIVEVPGTVQNLRRADGG